MLNAPTAAILGTVAAICSTVAFVPQIQKIFKTGGRDVSYSMLVLYLIGVSLWLGYGLTIRAAAVIWANALSAALVGHLHIAQADPGR
jgi:MtN3 and saliva related transmembrane protein